MRGRSAARRNRQAKRALAPLAGVALVGVAVLERLRRRRSKETNVGGGGEHRLEQNKLISRRLIEDALDGGRLEVVDELVAPTFVNHDPSATGDMVGRDGLRQLIDMYRTAFPDLRISLEDQLAEGDLVATRWSARGTHHGPILGIEPTAKQSTVTGITIDRIENGKIVESWNNWDTLGMLQQLGVMPALAEA